MTTTTRTTDAPLTDAQAAAVAVAFPELKDMALVFLLDEVPERKAAEQSATPATESPPAS